MDSSRLKTEQNGSMNRDKRISNLLALIPNLTDFQLYLIDDIVTVLAQPFNYVAGTNSGLIYPAVLNDFGDILRVHHSFSREPFSKDKFEYSLERILTEAGISATLAPRGTRGYDITISGEKYSLKTEAASSIREDIIHISKFMELGGGDWGDSPSDLQGLLDQFLSNLNRFERILTLRALNKKNPFKYELIEIPKALLSKAAYGTLEMRTKSKQYPKPGYCHVKSSSELQYSLYFDGGGERKLQIKNLQKKLCTFHASWEFSLPTHNQRTEGDSD